MGCNCKTKKNVDKIIKTVEELDNSKSKDYVRVNKSAMKVVFNMISIIVYALFGLMFILFILPAILYMAITNKPIKINLKKFIVNG